MIYKFVAASFIKERNVQPNKTFKNDLQNRGGASYRFATKIKLCLSTNDNTQWNFELGTMLFVLGKLNDISTVNTSPLLTDFKSYLYKYFSENLIDFKFLKELNTIKNIYRNRSAHPELISAEEARKGREDIRNAINSLMERLERTTIEC